MRMKCCIILFTMFEASVPPAVAALMVSTQCMFQSSTELFAVFLFSCSGWCWSLIIAIPCARITKFISVQIVRLLLLHHSLWFHSWGHCGHVVIDNIRIWHEAGVWFVKVLARFPQVSWQIRQDCRCFQLCRLHDQPLESWHHGAMLPWLLPGWMADTDVIAYVLLLPIVAGFIYVIVDLTLRVAFVWVLGWTMMDDVMGRAMAVRMACNRHAVFDWLQLLPNHGLASFVDADWVIRKAVVACVASWALCPVAAKASQLILVRSSSVRHEWFADE